MRPLIGIVSRVEYPGNNGKYVFNNSYRKRLLKYDVDILGILPPQEIDHTKTRYDEQPDLSERDKEILIRQINMCDGIILPGGFKTNKYDRFIVDYLIDNDIPTLGICLGMQQLSGYKKEILKNDKNESSVEHSNENDTCTHEVEIVEGTILYNIIKNNKIIVNSRHSYHIKPNDLFTNSAFSSDGYIESIELKDKKFIIGVQWHPEDIYDENSESIFNTFIDACKK